MVPEVTAPELAAEVKSGKSLVLVDVREADELAISVLPGVVHIPLGELPSRFGELDASAETVIICRVGGRSEKATQFLMGQGFTNVRNLVGGMRGYAAAIDPSMPVA